MDSVTYQEASKALADEQKRLAALVDTHRLGGLDETETWNLGELSSYDQHPADHGSETFEREKDLGLMLDAREQLEQVARAKQRLEEGAYGVCEECGWPVGDERLQALPSATLCLRCKQRRELGQDNFHRPVEEEVLSPPFCRTFDTGGPAFDGEDAWQAVASFGTSNSPQDVPDAIEFDDAYIEADEDTGTVEAVDGVIDLDYRTVSDIQEIYPDVQDNPEHNPHRQNWRLPGADNGRSSAWVSFTDMGYTSLTGTPSDPAEMDSDLWDYIRDEFPGDPEMEMADELSPADMEMLAREYNEAMRWEREH